MTRKRHGLAALLAAAAQLLAAVPATAAEIPGDGRPSGATRMDAFAGARLRVKLGGKSAGKARLGLTLAPTQRTESIDGAARRRFGEGLELSFAGRERPTVRVAGYSLAPGGEPGKDGRLGVSTVGAVAIGAGVVLLSAIVIGLAIRSGED